MIQVLNLSNRQKTISFIWQHLFLLISLFILTLGVALCVRSNLGSSVISSCPLAFTLAGEQGMCPRLSLGIYTNILNVLLVIGQIITLRRSFNPIQLFQLLIGIVFGAMIDANMELTASMRCDTLASQIAAQIGGCVIMAIGISLEIRCGSITMPGEGLPAAISKKTGKQFANIKIIIDIALVILAIASMLVFFGSWKWNVVGFGTLFAMVFVGALVKFISPRLAWFDSLLGYRPGFRRYLYGLAKFLNTNRNK